MNIERAGKQFVKCEMCEKFATLSNACALEWDWFTGRLDNTHHYCKEHKKSKERQVMFDLSGLSV